MSITLSAYRTIESVPQKRILEALFRFRYLTAEMLRDLLFSQGSLTYVYEHVRALTDGGYLHYREIPHGKGRPLRVYLLSAQGRTYLKAPQRFRMAEEREKSPIFLAHTLDANRLLILFLRSGYAGRYFTEGELRRRGGPVLFDGWVELLVDGYRYCLGLEVDRGWAGKKEIVAKTQSIVSYVQSDYERDFGTSSLTVLFVSQDRERALKLASWAQGDLFRFGAFDLEKVEPLDLFGYCWTVSGESVSRPLLEDYV